MSDQRTTSRREQLELDRRRFLLGLCAGGVATATAPSWSFAKVPGSRKLVFVILRGAMDGLASVVPFGDPDYRRLRGALTLDRQGTVSLAEGFALAPGLAPLELFWKKQELVALHAMAIPYRTRSHFDAQAILETGLDQPRGSSDGWLNRLLQVMRGQLSGIAIASGMPRSLQGDFPVSTWSPSRGAGADDTYLERLAFLYRDDSVLADPFEAALVLDETAGTIDFESPPGGTMAPEDRVTDQNDNQRHQMSQRPRAGAGVDRLMAAAARLIRTPEGPNVAALEISGWDTHAGQGGAGGLLDRRLEALARGLVTLRAELGDTWQNTTIVVMTEFGRTAAPNGSGGTDHGTAGAGFVIGPGVRKSQVATDWPGLRASALFEGRDLRPTLDTRAVLKAVVAHSFGLTTAQTHRVFPDSSAVRPLFDLFT